MSRKQHEICLVSVMLLPVLSSEHIRGFLMSPHLYLRNKSGSVHDETPAQTKAFCQWKDFKEKNNVQSTPR